MVKKLFKHEFLAWLRVLPLLYGITLVVAGMHRFVQLFEADSLYYNIILASASIMYGITVLAIIAAPVVFGIQRFYKNMFTGEGYLTHTLPVTPTSHLLVKCLTALAFSVLSALVAILSGVILCAGELLVEICKAGVYLVRSIPAEQIPHYIFYGIEIVLMLLVSTLATHLLYYFCICIGQLFRKNRILAAVGTYFALYMLSQMFSTVLTVLVMFTGILEPLTEWSLYHPMASVHAAFCFSIFSSGFMATVYYALCHYVVKKKLNLE